MALVVLSIGSWLVNRHRVLLMMIFDHLTLRTYLRHLMMKTSNTLMNNHVSLQISDPQRRTEFALVVCLIEVPGSFTLALT